MLTLCSPPLDIEACEGPRKRHGAKDEVECSTSPHEVEETDELPEAREPDERRDEGEYTEDAEV